MADSRPSLPFRPLAATERFGSKPVRPQAGIGQGIYPAGAERRRHRRVPVRGKGRPKARALEPGPSVAPGERCVPGSLAAGGVRTISRASILRVHDVADTVQAVRILLGHTKIESTVRYLGVDVEDALALAEHTEV